MSIIFLAILYVCTLQHCIFHALQYKEISQYYKSHLFHCIAGEEQKNTGTKKRLDTAAPNTWVTTHPTHRHVCRWRQPSNTELI